MFSYSAPYVGILQLVKYKKKKKVADLACSAKTKTIVTTNGTNKKYSHFFNTLKCGKPQQPNR